MTASTDGMYLVDKPAGPTSHDIVASIRRRLPRGTKVGHAGTLDPFATGLLVIAVGRATRLLRFVTGHDKTYRARVRLGATSVTGDPEGPVTPTDGPLPEPEAVVRLVAALPGRHQQRPPAYSAVKVDGERLYRRARRGEVAEAPPRTIVITSADLLGTDAEGKWFDLEVTCSSGTYIRQLAVDIGDRLGSGGYCEALRRTRIGTLDVRDAVEPDAVPAAGGVDTVRALDPMPAVAISEPERVEIGHGRPIVGAGDGDVALVCAGALVAIGHAGDGRIEPRVVLT